MITQMEVLTPRVTSSPLPIPELGTEETDPIQIKNIDGLGPVTASVSTSQYGSVDGEFYNGSAIGKRNIVLTIVLNPNWTDLTIELLRQYLYLYFMPKNEVTLRFTSTHIQPVEITGIVEWFEPNLFSKDPEYQISIICPDPAFVAVSATQWQDNTVALASEAYTNVKYEGTLPTGFVVTIRSNSTVTTSNSEIRILNSNPGILDVLSLLDINTTLVDSTHRLEISTLQGSKFVRSVLISTGVATNLLSRVLEGSTWPVIEMGDNHIQVLQGTPGQDWSLTYYARYGGL